MLHRLLPPEIPRYRSFVDVGQLFPFSASLQCQDGYSTLTQPPLGMAYLAGYARSIGKTSLPRVISFCAACYSIGLPPEILGLNALSRDDIKCMKDMHVNFPFDMQTAMSYFNEDVLTILPDEVKTSLKLDWGPYEVNEAHKAVTSRIIKAVKNRDSANLQGMLVEAAHIRKFLG